MKISKIVFNLNNTNEEYKFNFKKSLSDLLDNYKDQFPQLIRRKSLFERRGSPYSSVLLSYSYFDSPRSYLEYEDSSYENARKFRTLVTIYYGDREEGKFYKRIPTSEYDEVEYKELNNYLKNNIKDKSLFEKINKSDELSSYVDEFFKENFKHKYFYKLEKGDYIETNKKLEIEYRKIVKGSNLSIKECEDILFNFNLNSKKLNKNSKRIKKLDKNSTSYDDIKIGQIVQFDEDIYEGESFGGCYGVFIGSDKGGNKFAIAPYDYEEDDVREACKNGEYLKFDVEYFPDSVGEMIDEDDDELYNRYDEGDISSDEESNITGIYVTDNPVKLSE